MATRSNKAGQRKRLYPPDLCAQLPAPLTARIGHCRNLLRLLTCVSVLLLVLSGRAKDARDDHYHSTNIIEQVFLFKPAQTDCHTNAFTLAPLLLVEVRGSNLPARDRFGEVVASGGSPRLGDTPSVYYFSDVVTHSGKPRARQSYVWFYRESRSRPAGLQVQGIRMTLSPDGFPVVWEVLQTRGGQDAIYVAESLERAAKTNAGTALRGRRYSIERSLSDAPGTIVPRVLQDGPVPMGPIVYLSARTHCVHTVICRCMPSEAKSVLNSATFKLKPLSGVLDVLALLDERAREQLRDWVESGRQSKSLDARLRLPKNW